MTNIDKTQADTIKSWFKTQVEANKETRAISNPKHKDAILRGLLFLYARQTADEQDSGFTSHNNGMGFSGKDCEFLSSVASKALTYKVLSDRQAFFVAKSLVHYSGQLLELKKANATVASL